MDGINGRADINRVLMQMRDMQSQMRDSSAMRVQQDGPVQGLDRLPDVSKSEKSGFGEMLQTAVDAVNETQMKSAELQRAYELGEEGVDLTEVMIQMQKASVSFEAMTQVRNKLVTAYQDIMNMPI